MSCLLHLLLAQLLWINICDYVLLFSMYEISFEDAISYKCNTHDQHALYKVTIFVVPRVLRNFTS